MTELGRKIKKGHDIAPAVQSSYPSQSGLYFMTSHARKPAHVDLNSFATGVTFDELPKSQRKSFVPFTGRPSFIRELAPTINAIYSAAPSTTIENLLVSLRWWWRHLDRCEEAAPVVSVRDLNDFHYALYRATPSNETTAQMFFKIVQHARESLGLPRLYWTSITQSTQVVDLVSYEDVKRLYHFVKRPAFDALYRFNEAPNHVPSRVEVLQLFTLFVLSTGWNAGTALDIDISSKDGQGNLRCIVPHPQNESFCYVRSRKARAGGSIQYALSRKKSQISPSNIVMALYRQTKPLRDRLIRYLNILKWQLKRWEIRREKGVREINDRRVLIAALSREIKSPWLYLSDNVTTGRRRHLPIGDIAALRKYSMHAGPKEVKSPLVVWARQVNKNLGPGEVPIAENIQLSDLRDAYISWRWERSGYSWLDAMLAAGHKSLETLQRYLNKKQHKAASRREFLKVDEALWETIRNLRGIDASTSLTTVIAAKVAGASDAQIVRWLDSRDQTYVGTGCLDFHNPPEHFLQNRQPGGGCRFQRCTLCEHAILLPNSFFHLSKRLVELQEIQASISSISWLESDYPTELSNTEAALLQYSESEVATSIAHWESEMKNEVHSTLITGSGYA